MIICFIYLIRMFFTAKTILEFFQLFYLNFNLVHYARKKLYFYDDNLLCFCRILALKWAQEHLKMLIISKVIWNVRKHWNFDFFGISSSEFNKMTSFWSHFIKNFDGIQFIERTNFIINRIKIKIIYVIIEKQVVPQFWPVVYVYKFNIKFTYRSNVDVTWP